MYLFHKDFIGNNISSNYIIMLIQNNRKKCQTGSDNTAATW